MANSNRGRRASMFVPPGPLDPSVARMLLAIEQAQARHARRTRMQIAAAAASVIACVCLAAIMLALRVWAGTP